MILRASAHRRLMLRMSLLGVSISMLGFVPVLAEWPAVSTEQCEKRVSLDAFRAYVLHNSPVVASVDREYAFELGKAVDLESWTNPELQFEKAYTGMKVGGANDPQINANLGQPIRLSNFGSRDKVAHLIRKAGDSSRKAQILEVTQKFVVQFYTLAALYKSSIVLADAEGRAAKKVALIRQGVGKGLLSIGDQRLFEGEQYRLEAHGKGLAGQIAALQAEMGRDIGLRCLIIPEIKDLGIEIPSEDDLIAKAKKSGLSESSRLDLLNTLATEQARLADLDAYPQITPRLLYQHTNDGGDFIGAGISVPLPLWNRNYGERARAVAERSYVQRKKEYVVTGGLESQIRSLRQATVRAKEQLDIYSNKVVPSFGAALDAQERLYTEGKGNVLQVWETLKTYNQVRTDSVTLWLEAMSMRAHLSVLVGEEV
jgi:outer membrane protein TolC